jgi:ankyrin repeat protein
MAADSAQQLLNASEQAILNAPSLSIEYEALEEHNPAVGEITLKGKMFLDATGKYFLINQGSFVIFSAEYLWISNGKNYLCLSMENGVASSLEEWEPDNPGPFTTKVLVRRLVQKGTPSLIAFMLEDLAEYRSLRHERNFYPFGLGDQTKIIDLKLEPDDTVGTTAARHIKYRIDHQTKGVESVDLWLDAKSLLPVKRILTAARSGPITETYIFDLHPNMPREFFEPKRIIKEHKLELAVAQAENADARLLKAAVRGDETKVERMLKTGANPNAVAPMFDRQGPGLTALMLGAQSGNVRICELLIKSGAKIDTRSPSGATALEFAAATGQIDVFKSLMENGANVNCQDAEGLTPLMLAVWNGHADLVDLMLENGADPKIQSKKGKAAVDFVSIQTKEKMSAIFQKHGIKIPVDPKD